MSGGKYTLSTIAAVVDGVRSGTDPLIKDLAIDSRRSNVDEGTLFIALKGPRHDGHAYIGALFARGLRNFLVMEEPDPTLREKANFIRVKDTLTALQQLAAWHRSHFSYPVIGITGSNGKTIVKEWLFQMLQGEERIVRSPGSWNSQVGVPLSVWKMGPEHTLGLFEAGISNPGDMASLEAMIRPTIGILTTIGSAHDEGFKHLDGAAKVREKTSLFQRAQLWIHQNGPLGSNTLQRLLPNIPHKVWSMPGNNASTDLVQVVAQEIVGDATRIDLIHEGKQHTFTIPFTDGASLENALSCITVCFVLGRTAPWIQGRLEHLVPVNMRLRTMQGRHGTTLIDDSYSNDRTSLAVALEHQRRVAHGRKRVVILSDIAESDRTEAQLYQEVADLLERFGVDLIIAAGPHAFDQRGLFPKGSRFHADTASLLAQEDPKDLAGAVILVKGARAFAFERIVERWQQQVHGTELEIDLEAVRHNLNHYRALLRHSVIHKSDGPDKGHGAALPVVRTMAMVKAFGYGSGAVELARLFAHEQVHYLGVAYADEGIELRQHGIALPIMVMNPEPVAMETLHRFDLEPEVYDIRSLQAAMDYHRAAGSSPPVHLKLDTGMHRLGFGASELQQLCSHLLRYPALRVASILSHLAASENPDQDAFTRQQIATFSHMATEIGSALGYRPIWHLLNSGGISRWPSAHFDMVRVGIGLHGIGADDQETAQLMSVAALRTPIAQLKQLTQGETVGYGRQGVIEGERTIATLPIGYADGFSRRLGNGVGRVWVNGRPAPVIGNVCMDMCMVDVTGIPCALGDLAVVFDAEHSVSEIARDLGTIPYEVLTSIDQRVKRVYLNG